MTEQKKIETESALPVVYKITRFVGYWWGGTFETRADLIASATTKQNFPLIDDGIANGGWPVFGHRDDDEQDRLYPYLWTDLAGRLHVHYYDHDAGSHLCVPGVPKSNRYSWGQY